MMTHPLLVEALTLPYWISAFFAYFKNVLHNLVYQQWRHTLTDGVSY